MTTKQQETVALHAAWIAKKVRSMLSHYPSDWSMDQTVAEMAIDDWVDFLCPFSRAAIEHACTSYMRDQPRQKPSPGAIRSRAQAFQGNKEASTGDKSELTADQLHLLENKILPTARRWLDIPDLREHGEKTLAYWGEL